MSEQARVQDAKTSENAGMKEVNDAKFETEVIELDIARNPDNVKKYGAMKNLLMKFNRPKTYNDFFIAYELEESASASMKHIGIRVADKIRVFFNSKEYCEASKREQEILLKAFEIEINAFYKHPDFKYKFSQKKAALTPLEKIVAGFLDAHNVKDVNDLTDKQKTLLEMNVESALGD